MAEKEMLSVKEAAARLGVKRTSAWRILRKEPGVHLIYTPGSKKPIIRAEAAVVDRILRRTANQ